ncbi:MAG TPA: signal peptidase I [Actinomycetota bacterium]|nr:signal peptidase I [Actinomycetota bacterium]
MESQHTAPPPPPPPATPAEPEPDGASEPDAASPKKKHSFWRELPVLVVIAFVVALLIKTFLLQAFYIPSASMEPTLVEGDRVLVEKLSYRWGEPKRGDVVVFEKEFATAIIPAEQDDPFWEDIGSALKGLFGFPTGGTQDFIKRVIAVEGDTVEGRDGRVYVNGEPVDEPYLADGTETSPFGAVDIPKGMIFVMGDNRGNSDDSRAFGPIPVDEVVGHAFLLLWPPSDFDTL